MQLPFSHEQFLDVFAAYNRALWPAAAALWVISVAAFAAVLRGRRAHRFVLALLAAQWAWSAIAYQWAFFAAVNPAARAFAAAFALEALLLAASAWRPSAAIAWRPAAHSVGGATLVVYALVYPALAELLVGDYPRIPTFGVPCPTALLTIGFLLMADGGAVRLWILPLLWALVGGSAAVLFGVVPDFALFAAAAALLVRAARGRAALRGGSATRPEGASPPGDPPA